MELLQMCSDKEKCNLFIPLLLSVGVVSLDVSELLEPDALSESSLLLLCLWRERWCFRFSLHAGGERMEAFKCIHPIPREI